MQNLIRNQIERNIAQDNVIKDIRNFFRLKKDSGIKDKVLGDIRTLFEPEKDYYKEIKVINAFDRSYIEYERL